MRYNRIRFVSDNFGTKDFIPLHAPVFTGSEKAYVIDAIESTFVSSVEAYVDRLERDMASYTGTAKVVATVNGTAVLHIALRLAGVQHGDFVITQPLTFVATCNAIAYCNADPVLINVDRETLGLSAKSMETWLEESGDLSNSELMVARIINFPSSYKLEGVS